PAEGKAIVYGRKVAFHEISAETEEIARLSHIVIGKAWLTETLAVCQAQPVRAERLEGKMMRRAEGTHEACCHVSERAPELWRQQGQAGGVPFPLEGLEPAHENVKPLF